MSFTPPNFREPPPGYKTPILPPVVDFNVPPPAFFNNNFSPQIPNPTPQYPIYQQNFNKFPPTPFPNINIFYPPPPLPTPATEPAPLNNYPNNYWTQFPPPNNPPPIHPITQHSQPKTQTVNNQRYSRSEARSNDNRKHIPSTQRRCESSHKPRDSSVTSSITSSSKFLKERKQVRVYAYYSI